MRFRNILSDKEDRIFTKEFLEWCEGKEVEFKTKYLSTGKDIEIPINEVTKKLWSESSIFEDSLCMKEETAVLFKLTWL